MAFQTNVFRGGEWVTETVDVNAVLKASAPKAPKKQRLLKPPRCGLLTRSVVESQLVNTVLPVRLRSPRHNDIAFIGDHAVQIRELRQDGQLRDVIRKDDFGSRIRNAAVIGTLPDDMNGIKQEEGSDADEHPAASLADTDDDDDVDMHRDVPPARTPSRENFPPQLLLLVLECGDSVFISVRSKENGSLDFVTSRFESPKQHLVYPGFHLAVDPSSRYAALGCAQHYFVIYELEPMRTLNARYRRNEPLRPVRSYRPRAVQGVIHKIEFLYPRPLDKHHIILLLIVVRNGKSRMVTYEWELGDDLASVFAEEKNGHRMPVENQMPLLLIPLTVRSAFIAISPSQLAVCTEALHGPPNFERIDVTDAPATINYHGLEKPLWTAWARPFRLSSFFKSRDCIYLAREDGAVIFVEFDAESILTGSIFMDKFDCNISAAFSCLYEQYSDILVMAGDSGPGAVWKVPARQPLEQLGTLPNSCPVVDFVTTDEHSTWNDGTCITGDRVSTREHRQPTKPSRIFATSGRGQKGSVTEYRYGLQAKIGLDLEYGIGVKQAWVFPAWLSHDSGFHLLLSMPDQTVVLYLSADLSQGSEPEAGTIQYDISSRTLAATTSEDLIVQVTESCIVLITPSQSSRFSYEMLEGYPSLVTVDAAILDDCIAVSTHADTRFRISVLGIRSQDQASIDLVASFVTDGEVTCLSLCRSLEDDVAVLLAGIWRDERPWLAYARLGENGHSTLEMVDLAPIVPPSERRPENTTVSMEPIANIASYIYDREQIVMLGMRSGEVVSLSRLGPNFYAEAQRFGVTAASALVSSDSGRGPFALVLCDSNLVMLSGYNAPRGEGRASSGSFPTRVRVWPVDVSNPTSASPPVDSVTILQRNLFSEREDTTSLLLLSGSRVLIAELQRYPEPVHRTMPVEGTPMRIIYSRHLNCLIVAVNRRDSSTLVFLDPDTGEDLGKLVDKEGREIPAVPGFGKQGDRVFDLAEWEYRRESGVWRFILVSTRDGRLIILSAEKEDPAAGGRPRIRYWVRFKKPGFNRPIYSVLPHEDGMIYCVGETIYWDVLDLSARKLKTVKTFDLNSPATALQVANGKLLALTSRDSLEVIDLSANPSAENWGLVHVDPRTRNGVHMIEVAGARLDEPMSSITLISDRECGVGGLWVPWQVPGKDCEPIFEAELPASIRKFRRGRTRPYWEQEWHAPKYGRMVSTVDDADILGICLDGSLQHFTLLNLEIWRFLRFIQNLALTSPELYPFTYETVDPADYDPEPPLDEAPEMHVDGDMLQRCLEKRALERLITWPSHISRFSELLDELEDGKYTAGFGIEGQDVRERYFELAYVILEYFLSPVL